ncbi:transcriptional activator HlyU [Rhizobium leguminosarum bv. viciae]|uniref:Transcriptional activator HlyU n=1 Tax=Rhizobium leguminosarum bv. viciae TaxID=387 RepID=A0A8I2GPA7_RHILV|nr:MULTISPECIES: HlyU family transcriptional regulator [Rhizobium]MBN9983750.1 transcriptional activator HlyU [Rhizobium laguerreae]MBY3072330.1 transcriptional activator HlyU [Rhizobium laguerreae]MBY3083772.1 transcriptional activator HlyU [Rhizobium laguerreae]MBY3091107.1 transcriptional activator HlyU [Rhizobium laguerreae]MBY3100892.1 transcriptional activator HlyU [Rhizobium laguerreae]
MASFISNIFSMFSGGGKPASEAAGPSGEPQLYGDCTIYAEPRKEGGQYRLAGRIEKKVGDEVLVRNFIRADLFSSSDDAIECTVRKAQQIIDQHGSSLFGDGEKLRQV